jgi:hypothetical protein
MTEPNSQPSADRLDRAVAALRDAPLPAGPSPQLVAATTDALESAIKASPIHTLPPRRTLMFHLVRQGAIAAVAAGLLLAVCFFFSPERQAAASAAEVKLDGTTYQIHGPYSHEDLAVFLVCSDRKDEHDFLTLDEGLKEGLVKITEQEQERVGALWVDNQSDRPLYLQEGERLQGGKQDRTIVSSLVIPPKSGRTAVPTLCVERSRWVEGKKGRAFGFTVDPALAPKGVRGAAKVEGSQERVWGCVQAQKLSAAKKLNCPNTSSSVNEMLDSAQVRRIAEEYANALEKALDASGRRDVVGMAVVLNGQIEEVNIYPGRGLFRKLYPRLIRAYALQAALLKDQARATEPVTVAAVIDLLQTSGTRSKREKNLDARNAVRVSELDGNLFQCTTCYNGKPVHWQMMKKNRKGGGESCAILGSDW